MGFMYVNQQNLNETLIIQYDFSVAVGAQIYNYQYFNDFLFVWYEWLSM